MGVGSLIHILSTLALLELCPNLHSCVCLWFDGHHHSTKGAEVYAEGFVVENLHFFSDKIDQLMYDAEYSSNLREVLLHVAAFPVI